MNVVNECRIYFKYRFSQVSPIISETKDSNRVSTEIIKDILEVEKYVSKERTYCFGFLTYTIIIYNPSIATVTGVIFKDNIPENTRFIKNSIMVNALKRRCVNPEKGIFIGKIKSHEDVKISFKVLVLPLCKDKVINNYSTVEYDYIYNVEKPPYRIEVESNKVASICENRVFKQILIAHTIKTPYPIDKVVNVKYDLKIVETKIINYFQSEFSTLVVIGKVSYKIFYLSHCHKEYEEDVVGFSTCMLVPYGINYGNKNDIKAEIEDFSPEILDSKRVYFSISLLLHY